MARRFIILPSSAERTGKCRVSALIVNISQLLDGQILFSMAGLSRDLFRYDAMRTNGKRDNHIVVNHEKDTVTIRNIEIKNLMLVPNEAIKFVTPKRWMPPIGTEEHELFACQFLNLRRKVFKFAFEPNSPPEDHRP
jgi:hypothetical protein